MLYELFTSYEIRNTIVMAGALLSFFLTFIGIRIFEKYLPTDGGREFAVDGNKSVGKHRGAGIIFILVFTLVSLIFGRIKLEYVIYLLVINLCMLTGYMDDSAEKPWGELKKGILDLGVSVVLAYAYTHYHGMTIRLALVGVDITIPRVIFSLLVIALVWGSINVTNCCDGVDGLCCGMSIASTMSIYALAMILGKSIEMGANVLFMIMALLAYLWYNSTPSRVLMGDAGSRAIGVFLAIAILLSGAPFMYILLCLIIMFDGGLGLVKLTVIRVFKAKNFMSRVRTPLHDQFRKKHGWSNTQVVNRFLILQVLISLISLAMVKN